MKQEMRSIDAPDRLVIVRTPYRTSEKKTLCFAFTTRQVLEVRNTVVKRPVPFADSPLLGLCPWKNRILPVVDLEAELGLQGKQAQNTSKKKYLILRTGMRESMQSGLSYAIVRVPDQISILSTDNIPPAPLPEDISSHGVRGIYHFKNQVLIVPDLQNIFHVENGHS